MRRIAPLLACLILALVPATAEGKKKHKKPPLGPVVPVSATGNTATGQGAISTAVANCPAGKLMIGGGFSLAGNPSEAAVYESYRSGPGSWTASSVQGAVAGSSTVTAFGYCRRSRRPISDVTGTATVPADLGSTGSASATCPTGTQLVGGGFQSTVLPNSFKSSFPQTNLATGPSTWTLISLNNSSATPTITAHAYCLAGIRAPTRVQGGGSLFLAQDETATAFSPSCPVTKKKKGKKPKPRKLLSAGGFSTPTPTAEPRALFFSSSAQPTGWFAKLVNASNTAGTLSATSQGICA